MDEKPKSIWKKSWQGPGSLLLGWLVLMIVFAVIFYFFMLPTNAPLARSGEELRLLAGLELGMTMVVLLILFIRWMFCWRNFKRSLFGLACLATLVALFYAEEDWRGKRAWENYKHEWEAKGEKYDLKDFVPPPVPDDQNFALTPVVASSYAAMIDKTGHEIIPRNTNVINRLEWNTGRPNDNGTAPTNADWTQGTVTDLKSWQAYYRTLTGTNQSMGKVTNDFPVPPQPGSPAEDVLLALGKYDPALSELREAAKLPASRFPVEYDKENPAMILLPHLAAMKRCSLVIQLRAIAELQSGQSAKALEDIKLNFRLMEAVRSEPFIISQLVRFAILQLTLQPVYEGLAAHQWSDAQLVELEGELVKLDCLEDYAISIRCEPAAHIKLIDYLERDRGRGIGLLDELDRFDVREDRLTFGAHVLFYLAPKGWFYQNELQLAQLNRQWNQPMVDTTKRVVVPKMVQEHKAAEAKLEGTPYGFLAQTLLPWLGTYAQKTALAQNAADLALVALALERNRLAHGDYPEVLEALAPRFIASLPHDVIGGGPLKYRRTSDGRFVLYSIGWNEKDDGGVVAVPEGGSHPEWGPQPNYEQGDWVWQYPQK